MSDFSMEKVGNVYTFALSDDSGPLPLNVPVALSSLTDIILLDIIDAYICFYGDFGLNTKRIFMWNPKWETTDRQRVKYVYIDIRFRNPHVDYKPRVGLGVHPHTGDVELVVVSGEQNVKLFKIDTELGEVHLVSKTAGIPISDPNDLPTGDVERVVSFGEQGELRTMVTEPGQVVEREAAATWPNGFFRDLECAKVCEQGVIYFRAYDNIFAEKRSNFVVSFNLVTEVFEKVSLPGRLTETDEYIQMVNINGSPGLLEYHHGECDVWIKKEGDNEFTYKHTIGAKGKWLYGNVSGFKRNAPRVEPSGSRLRVRSYE